MKNKTAIQEKILNQPSYWVEGVNGILYDIILTYMEENNMNRTQLAEHLGISKGRVSQILNEGDINFSLEKIIEISLKIGKFPVFNFEDKQEYLNKKADLKAKKMPLLSITKNKRSVSNE
jgi:transcriptional regulator with XRE-family HTH domain